jgi:hypothetical protein
MRKFLLFAAGFFGAFVGTMLVALVLCSVWVLILSFISGIWAINYEWFLILLKTSIVVSLFVGFRTAIKNSYND